MNVLRVRHENIVFLFDALFYRCVSHHFPRVLQLLNRHFDAILFIRADINRIVHAIVGSLVSFAAVSSIGKWASCAVCDAAGSPLVATNNAEPPFIFRRTLALSLTLALTRGIES